jgi:hypothetical protein
MLKRYMPRKESSFQPPCRMRLSGSGRWVKLDDVVNVDYTTVIEAELNTIREDGGDLYLTEEKCHQLARRLNSVIKAQLNKDK